MLVMRPLIILLVLLFAILQYTIWFSDKGIKQTFSFKKAIAKQEEKNAVLYKANEVLIKNVHRLKENKNAVEILAREKIGMVKKGEAYYQLVESPQK